MTTIKNSFTILGLMFLAQASTAQVPLAVSLPAPLDIVGMPLEIGGVTAIAAVSLIIGAQLIKRRKK